MKSEINSISEHSNGLMRWTAGSIDTKIKVD